MSSAPELNVLLNTEESDTLERKASLADTKSIQKAIIAFANDLAGRGGGKIIIGQTPDKKVIGLKADPDEASRIISHIARTECHPAIHVKVSILPYEDQFVAVIDVPASTAKPHFRGECFVRQGSTNRVATDAEAIVLRAAGLNPKVRQLLKWKQEGYINCTCVPLPTGHWGNTVAAISEIHETYVVLKSDGITGMTPSIEDLQLGWDDRYGRPKLMFHRYE